MVSSHSGCSAEANTPLDAAVFLSSSSSSCFAVFLCPTEAFSSRVSADPSAFAAERDVSAAARFALSAPSSVWQETSSSDASSRSRRSLSLALSAPRRSTSARSASLSRDSACICPSNSPTFPRRVCVRSSVDAARGSPWPPNPGLPPGAPGARKNAPRDAVAPEEEACAAYEKMLHAPTNARVALRENQTPPLAAALADSRWTTKGVDSSLVMPGTGGETRMTACEGTAEGTARAGLSSANRSRTH